MHALVKATREPLRGHANPVRSVAYSPDSMHVVSCSDGKNICVRDTQTIGKLIDFENGLSQITGPSHDNLHIIYNAQHVKTHICNPGCRHDGPHKVWTINADGWVVVDGSKLLVRVPPDPRDALLRPQSVAVISRYGFLQLEFDDSRMGEHW
ncbi:hypothetical protein FRC08_016671 [Ceratobasidium sp. 394]|nr:hypothetical protein FRC08_016671 [Ceratobasidium sp. 394]